MVGAYFITGKAVGCDTPSVLQHQGFLGQQTTQVDFCSAITDGGQILIDRRASSHGQRLNKISGTAHTEPEDVIPAIGVDRLWPYLFSGGNI